MASGIYLALSGAVAQGQALDVLANNVANASTTGFHASRIRFDEALVRARAQHGRIRMAAPGQRFVQAGATTVDSTPGAIRQTGNPLDLAIDGQGWFSVDTPRGARYTRGGDFHLDGTGRIVTSEGYAVRGQGGSPLTVPPEATQILVQDDGEVTADGNSIGALEIARFPASALSREGATLFALARPDAAEPPPDAEAPHVVQGSIESGNFNVVRGMVDLVRVSRTYEALHRMIETYKETDDRAARSIGTGT
jgi:flagellar basal-body rod protein FlgG